jgi:O-antigen/teichoic acid export membrane protein
VTRGQASTAQGALVGIATVVAERAVAFGVVMVLARVLAPEAFGRYGYLLAGMTLVQVVADQGIEVAAVAAMSASSGATASMLGAVLVLRLLVWLAVAVPVGWLVLPALATGGDGAELARAGLAASGLVLVGGSISMRGVRRARGAMTAMARVALADALAGGAAIACVALAGGGLAAIFAARVLASLTVTAAVLAFGPDRPAAGSNLGRTIADLVRVAAPLGGNAVLIAIHTRAGHLIAMMLAGPAVVGLLGAAARVTEVLGVVPEGALLAIFPRMAASPDEAPALAAATARRLAVLVLALVVPLAVGASAVARILFGDAYAPAAPAIAILAWIALFAVTGNVTFHAIVARRGERVLVLANLVAAVVGVALQVVLVPRFGLEGAAFATVATAALGQLALAVPALTRHVVVRVWRAVLPLALLAGAVVTAGRDLAPSLTGAVAALAVYAVAAVVLGQVDLDDVRLLWGALRPSR